MGMARIDLSVLNVAMFGVTVAQWREANPDEKGNIRDYATINELICLSNMNQSAIHKMSILESSNNERKLL